MAEITSTEYQVLDIGSFRWGSVRVPIARRVPK